MLILKRRRLFSPAVHCGAAAPAYSALINFRGTAGYVTDGVGQTYCLGTDTYPTVRAGLTFGWENFANGIAQDRNSSLDPRLAGSSPSFGVAIFRLDLPASGLFNCDIAAGDTFNQSDVTWEVRDTSTVLASQSTPYFQAANHWFDINGVDFNGAAAWIAGHTPKALTFSTTIYRLKFDGSAGAIAHLSVVK